MPEPIDAILPILQRIQGDLAETKRELGRKIDANTASLAEHGKKLDAIEGYLTYSLGVTSRNTADVEELKTEILAIKERVEALEGR
jgi:hypothetical protein